MLVQDIGAAPRPFVGSLDWKQGIRPAVCALALAHIAGAVFVFVYLGYVAPSEATSDTASAGLDIVFFIAYALLAFPLTGWACERLARRTLIL